MLPIAKSSCWEIPNNFLDELWQAPRGPGDKLGMGRIEILDKASRFYTKNQQTRQKPNIPNKAPAKAD